VAAAAVGQGGRQGRGKGGGGPATVTTTVLAPLPWSDSLQALGTAAARESVTITAKVSEKGRAGALRQRRQARAGQVLVTLSDRAQSAGVGEAAADYAEAQKTYERMQAAGEAAARRRHAARRAARRARRRARARWKRRRRPSATASIVAPFAGVLGLRQVSPVRW
jgi:membrane fusion protein (multidrug efflux system)